MIRIINIISLSIFFIFGTVLSAKLLYHNYLFLGSLAIVILIISALVFLRPKAYAFRFMYPGLLTFLLFMVLPILFTVYIGFTNLSTGHFLGEEQVYEILKEETYVPGEVSALSFELSEIPQQNQLQIFVFNEKDPKQNYIGKFKKELGDNQADQDTQGTQENRDKQSKSEENKVELSLSPLRLRAIRPLSMGQIYRLRQLLTALTFVLPDQTELKYYRTSTLAPVFKRYTPLDDLKLKDNATKELFYPDYDTGFYTNGKENISPGFYITIGLDNFTSLFTSDKLKNSFIKIVIWTLVWAGGTVFLTFALGMFLSIVLNDRGLKLKPFYRMLLIIPYSIPFFISVLIFRGMLNKDFGIINEIIASIGLPKIDWLGHPICAKISCLLVNLWLGFPYMFLVTTGILQSIPNSVYEAAALDGAGKWATFKSITLPMVMSAVGPLLVGSFAFNLNNFVGIYLLTGGGPPIPGASTPAGETDILISYTYRLAFEGGRGQDFGLASSIAIFIFIIITILTLINFKVSGMMKEQKV